jgi:hypothetical protein
MTDQAAGGFASIALPNGPPAISSPCREVAALLAEALNLRSLKLV